VGLSPCGCFAAKVALILSGGCLAAIVAGSLCGYFATIAILVLLSGRYFAVERVQASYLADALRQRLL
jgi:nitrate reductase gamma subunit